MVVTMMVWKKRALLRTMGLAWKGGEGGRWGVVKRDTDIDIDG